MSNKLFLICPECHIEELLKQKYGTDITLLTALGSIYLFKDFEDSEELNEFLNSTDIKQLYIVVSLKCTFPKNVIEKKEFKQTLAEKAYNQVYLDNIEEFLLMDKTEDRLKHLIKLTLEEQLRKYKEYPFIGPKIQEETLQVKAVIVNPDLYSLTEIDIH